MKKSFSTNNNNNNNHNNNYNNIIVKDKLEENSLADNFLFTNEEIDFAILQVKSSSFSNNFSTNFSSNLSTGNFDEIFNLNEKKKIIMEDVIGCEQVKSSFLQSILWPISYPSLFSRFAVLIFLLIIFFYFYY